jgi:hypothetical protein
LPENIAWLARVTPNPAAPTSTIMAIAIVFDLPQKLHGFIFSPSRICFSSLSYA